jgi:3-oxoadipate enol-lactonase
MTEQVGAVAMGDGCRIAYRLDGPVDAPILLLSNSLGSTMEMWDPQVEPLSRHCRLLRYDSRGHGRSGVPPGAYSLDRLGRDVIELLDALRLERVHFCGVSKGGMVGQWLGYRAPERIDLLVLSNTSAYMGPPSSWDARIAAVTEGGMTALAEAVVERWFTPAFRRPGNKVFADAKAMILATDPMGYAGCCAAIRDMDLRPTAPLIARPTLVIAGTEDPATPPTDGQAIASAIRGARLATLPAAHLSNLERPHDYCAILLDFLAG